MFIDMTNVSKYLVPSSSRYSSSIYKSESMTVAGNFITSVGNTSPSCHIPETSNDPISRTVIFIQTYINIVNVKVILKKNR